jgi:hypothetical protein
MDVSENPVGQLAPGASGSSGLAQGLPVPSSHIVSTAPGACGEEGGQRGAPPGPERAGLEPSSHAGSLPSAHESVPPAPATTAAEPSSQLAGDAPLALAGAVPAAAWVLAAPRRRWSRLAACRRRPLGRCAEHPRTACLAWVAHGTLRPAAIAGSASSESSESASARSVRRWGRPVFKWGPRGASRTQRTTWGGRSPDRRCWLGTGVGVLRLDEDATSASRFNVRFREQMRTAVPSGAGSRLPVPSRNGGA